MEIQNKKIDEQKKTWHSKSWTGKGPLGAFVGSWNPPPGATVRKKSTGHTAVGSSLLGTAMLHFFWLWKFPAWHNYARIYRFHFFWLWMCVKGSSQVFFRKEKLAPRGSQIWTALNFLQIILMYMKRNLQLEPLSKHFEIRSKNAPIWRTFDENAPAESLRAVFSGSEYQRASPQKVKKRPYLQFGAVLPRFLIRALSLQISGKLEKPSFWNFWVKSFLFYQKVSEWRFFRNFR